MSDRRTLLITILIGAAGWLITQLVDRLGSSPTIEYSIQESAKGQDKEFSIHLANLTHDRAFDDVEVIVTATAGGTITSAYVQPKEPSSEGNMGPNPQPGAAEFHLQRFMPGAEATLVTHYKGSLRPKFRATSIGGTARFVKRGLETCFLRHEAVIFIAVAGITVLVVIFFLIAGVGKASRNQKSES